MADNTDFQLQNSMQAIEFARECVRSGIIINGGAAVAVLALLSGSSPHVTDTASIKASLYAFSLGVFACMLACIAGYIAQTMFAAHNADQNAGRKSSAAIPAIGASWVGVILIFGSALCFLFGLHRAAVGLGN